MNELELTYNMFDKIKHFDQFGREYWKARELCKALNYREYRNFVPILKKAKTSCNNSKQNIKNHFVQSHEMISLGKGGTRKVDDYKLSRYACYLIVQNADPKKDVVALAQTYFAIQTRKQELSEKAYSELTEDEKRFYQRDLTRKGNYSLNQAAKNAGVKNFDRFHNAGYKGLYNGETANDIAKRKGLRYREEILDNMGSEELADNLFRIVHTESKLKKDRIKGESNASNIHYEVGIKIRNTIKELGGTMPEDLPTPDKSLRELEKEKIIEFGGNNEISRN